MKLIILFILIVGIFSCSLNKKGKAIHSDFLSGEYFCDQFGMIEFKPNGEVVNIPEYAGLAVPGNSEIYYYYPISKGWIMHDTVCSTNGNSFYYAIDTTYQDSLYSIVICLTTCDKMGYNSTFRNPKFFVSEYFEKKDSQILNIKHWILKKYTEPYSLLYIDFESYNMVKETKYKYLHAFAVEYYSQKNGIIKYEINFNAIDSAKIIINIPRDINPTYYIKQSKNKNSLTLINKKTGRRCRCKKL